LSIAHGTIRLMLRWVVLLCTVGCRIHDVDLTGKACPCPSDYVCDLSTQTCVHSLPIDARRDDGGDAAPGSKYPAAVLAAMPVGYWRLGDAGSTAKDEIGANDGTYVGTCVKSVTGGIASDLDTAVGFDGTSCQVMLPDKLAFLGNAAFSLEAWVDVLTPT